MYHIKVDKRAQRSAGLIVQGVNACLQKKEYRKITIADVLEESTVGRATFYRLFDSISDVLSYECDLMFEQINHESSKGKTLQDILVLDIETFMRHDVLLETIVNSHQLNIIYDAQLRQINQNIFFKIELASPDQQDFYLAVLTNLLISTLSTWINHGKKESADELFVALQASITMLNQTIND
ncbi:hypothetical protein [Fructobacillus ficulneus]|uniref:HTH tetR-type domain-containing protein n=1 Tax=Fructobacillus ficulneus TaxID=157463 RepID=A0A0K8MFI6_9LACO|nr:hypothetical protein [Fructobacillus ficulneus]GAO99306.1 hypothetical protein FFIC_091330 [Fructobacillus ficulneus]